MFYQEILLLLTSRKVTNQSMNSASYPLEHSVPMVYGNICILHNSKIITRINLLLDRASIRCFNTSKGRFTQHVWLHSWYPLGYREQRCPMGTMMELFSVLDRKAWCPAQKAYMLRKQSKCSPNKTSALFSCIGAW